MSHAPVSRISDWNPDRAQGIRVKKAVLHSQYRVHPLRTQENAMIYVESCPATIAFISPYTDGNNNKSIRICNTRFIENIDVIGRMAVSRIKDAIPEQYTSCVDDLGNITCTVNVRRCKVYDAHANPFPLDMLMLHVRVRVILRIDGIIIGNKRCYTSLYIEQMVLDEALHLQPPTNPLDKYVKMLSVGVPLEAVRQKMVLDNCPPDVMELLNSHVRQHGVLSRPQGPPPPPPPRPPPPKLCLPTHRVPSLSEILEARSRLKTTVKNVCGV